MKTTEEIVEYCTSVKFDDLPEEVIGKAKECVLDSLGCAIGGSVTDVGRILIDVFSRLGGNPESTIIGCWKKVSPTNAAFVNSKLANILDFDDTIEGIGHLGATIIPPAIAVSESLGSNGRDFITSIVLGYEISSRIGAAVLPSPQRFRYVWGLGTYQTFGSAVAVAKLLKLDEKQYLNALGIAGSNAPVASVRKTVLSPLGPTMVKNNFGSAASVGVLAALLAKRGFTGPRDILDGETGFWRMYGSDQCDFEKMTRGLGSNYEILNVSFKPYPCCRWIHPCIDATLKIIEEYRISPKDINEIKVKTFSAIVEPPYDAFTPKSMLEAEFSVPYSIAVAIYGVEIGPKWYVEDTLKNPSIIELAKKVKLERNEEAERLFPKKMLSIVEIKSKLGTYEIRVDTPKGDPKNPLTDHELENKFQKLARATTNINKIKEAIKLIKNLEEIEDVRYITVTLKQ